MQTSNGGGLNVPTFSRSSENPTFLRTAVRCPTVEQASSNSCGHWEKAPRGLSLPVRDMQRSVSTVVEIRLFPPEPEAFFWTHAAIQEHRSHTEEEFGRCREISGFIGHCQNTLSSVLSWQHFDLINSLHPPPL